MNPSLPLWRLPAAVAARRMAAGTLTSEAYVQSFLERIEAREGAVQAWAHVEPDRALAYAREADRTPRRSPLHGLPFGVKDVSRTSDLPTRHNSPLYRDAKPLDDAACVAVLRASGGVLLGKLQTLEFAAAGHLPPTRNPHDLSRTPGGSSSGSAAAVAAGMVPLALGTQTGGSTIRPAAFCGVYALKPTFGQIALDGTKSFSPHLDTIGFFGRSPDDLRLVAGAYRLLEDGDGGERSAAGLHIALCETPFWREAEPDAQAALLAAAERLAKAGHRVSAIELPEPFAALNRQHDEIMQDGGRGAFLSEYLTAPDRLHQEFKDKVGNHLGLTPERMRVALDAVALRRIELDSLLSGFDALMCLSAPGEAPVGIQTQGLAVFNRMWTALHVPCISVPGLRGRTGLPIGIQLVQRRYEDAKLLEVARAVARVIDAESLEEQDAWN